MQFKRLQELDCFRLYRNMQIHGLPKVGDTITTTVDVMEEIFGMTLANSTVQLGKNILVTAEMKIALKNDGTESK